jgi:hypothetical protein
MLRKSKVAPKNDQKVNVPFNFFIRYLYGHSPFSRPLFQKLKKWPKMPKISLVPRACDPREGTRGSGIIRFREESDWPLKWNA